MSKQKQMSLDKDIKDIEKTIKSCEDNNERLLSKQHRLLSSIKKCKNKILEYKTSLSNQDISESESEINIEIDDKTFADYYAEIVKAKELKIDEYSVDDLIEIYKDLQKKIKLCQKYLSSRNMNIKFE